jgi:hypothetical protein
MYGWASSVFNFVMSHMIKENPEKRWQIVIYVEPVKTYLSIVAIAETHFVIFTEILLTIRVPF